MLASVVDSELIMFIIADYSKLVDKLFFGSGD